MDPVESSPRRSREGEDLEVLLYKSGLLVKRTFSSIGKIFSDFFQGLLFTLIFLIRNILWIALGTIVGMAYGIYVLNKTGASYYSEMTVKTNYSSAQALYKSMDYFNALISTHETKQLASYFSISEAEAEKLNNFSAEEVKSELITAGIYRDQFLREGRSDILRQDTFWTRTIDYKDFKKSLTRFDYPLHKIVVVSTNPNVFGKLQKGIINYISQIKLFQDLKTNQEATNTQEEQWITQAIEKLDTLRQAYNARLMKGDQGNTSPGTNQVTVLSPTKAQTAPELELYNKMLELIDERNTLRRRSVSDHDIVEVYSPFNPVGQKISFFQQSIIKYSLVGLVAALLIILIITFYKYLVALERQMKKRSGQPQGEI